ncbi:MAG: HEAT repeat domain-containing protein [Candidatus Latescibacterota bacterium]|nr:MAG: HEAT repeat domain-containing protein [Candidatus Latescibacterota bacterium]
MLQRKSNPIWMIVSIAAFAAGDAAVGGERVVEAAVEVASDGEVTLSRALDSFLVARAQEDPEDPGFADFEKAREALNRARYRDAAKYFERVHEKYGESAYADDALYWHAFALYKRGRRQDLDSALEQLQKLYEGYRGTATYEDAQELEARIHARLAELGEESSAKEVTGYAQEGDDEELRIIALNALLQMNPDKAMPILRKVLIDNRDKSSVEMRERAIFILSQKQSPETLGIMLDVARNDPDLEVRENAVFWLSQVRGPEAVDALEEILLNSEEEAIQEKAIFALSQHRSAHAGAILREYARDSSKSVELRENAIFWLGQHHADENFEFLTGVYADLDEPALKEKVIFSIAQQQNDRSQAWLLERVRDESEEMELRENALFWAGQQGLIACEDLRSLYDTFEDPELREKMIFVVSQRRESACVDILIHIVRTEEDFELRKNAIFWLSQTNDPRAIGILEELIEP